MENKRRAAGRCAGNRIGQGTVGQHVDISLQIAPPLCAAGDLPRSLRRNTSLLKRLDVLVPKPQWYAGRVVKMAEELRGQPASEESLRELWADERQEGARHRVVLSEPRLMGGDAELFRDGRFLPAAALRPAWLQQSMGPGVQLGFFICLRNPAALIDAALRNAGGRDAAALLDGADPFSVRWSDVILRLRQACPDVPVTVWMKEEQPYVWPQLMHAASGLYHPVLTDGVADDVAGFLRPEVAAHLEAYLKKYDNYDADFLARAFEHFTRKYAARDQSVEVIDVPGWTAGTVSGLTAAYMEDMNSISSLDGVTFLSA